MSWLRERPMLATLVGFVVATIAVVAIAAAYGLSNFARAWDHVHGGWLVVSAVCELLAIPAYGIVYRALARFEDGPHLSAPLLMRVVTAGFGPFAVHGGFVLDKKALHALEGDEESATVRVLGLGALEWALLAPTACIAAIVLLATGDPRPMPSLLWPWAIAVPLGFAVGLSLASPKRVKRIESGDGRVKAGVAKALRGVDILRSLSAACPAAGAPGWGWPCTGPSTSPPSTPRCASSGCAATSARPSSPTRPATPSPAAQCPSAVQASPRRS